MLFITINYQNTEALCEIQSFKQQPMKIIENPILSFKINYHEAEALCERQGFKHRANKIIKTNLILFY